MKPFSPVTHSRTGLFDLSPNPSSSIALFTTPSILLYASFFFLVIPGRRSQSNGRRVQALLGTRAIMAQMRARSFPTSWCVQAINQPLFMVAGWIKVDTTQETCLSQGKSAFQAVLMKRGQGASLSIIYGGYSIL